VYQNPKYSSCARVPAFSNAPPFLSVPLSGPRWKKEVPLNFSLKKIPTPFYKGQGFPISFFLLLGKSKITTKLRAHAEEFGVNPVVPFRK
jgi:hypothetical protein